MSVLHLAQSEGLPLYRRSVAALADAFGRGPALLSADNLTLLAISLLVSLGAALRARLFK